MRILLLTHAFNGLAQRLHVELASRGHVVSVEFDIADSVTREAVGLFRPDLVVAPFLKRAIPDDVWRRIPCLVVHPGIVGDRGPSALDWAIREGEREWGVTLLQANAEMDAGDVWAAETFPMRVAAKSSLYRREVTDAAARCVLQALERAADPSFRPTPVNPADPAVRGRAPAVDATGATAHRLDRRTTARRCWPRSTPRTASRACWTRWQDSPAGCSAPGRSPRHRPREPLARSSRPGKAPSCAPPATGRSGSAT